MKDQRTDQELNRIIENWRFGEPQYFVMKLGYFFRPKAAGYTDRTSEAWRVPLEVAKRHEYLRGREPVTIHLADPLPYSTDLNSIHEAEKKLTTDPQQERYQCGLVNIMLGKSFGDYLHWTEVGMVFVANAEARQKAEALVAFIESEKGEE